MPVLVRDGREDAEFGIQVFIDGHDRGDISATIAVVRRRPHRNDRLLWKVELVRRVSAGPEDWGHSISGTYLVTLVHELMGPGDGF